MLYDVKLSEYGNKVLREELKYSNFRSKISIAHHNLPYTFQQNIYGDPDRLGFDGVHLFGTDGRISYTKSVCNILQKTCIDSRELHNHIPLHNNTFPASPAHSVPNPANPPAQYDPKTTSTKPDHIIVDIEDDLLGQYTYNIPTYNNMTLGN